MAKKPIKLGRGRPTKEVATRLAMLEAQSEVKEKMILAYPEAGDYIIDVLKGKIPSTPQVRMAAAKTVKDLVENWLKESSEEDEELEENTDPQDNALRVVNIG